MPGTYYDIDKLNADKAAAQAQKDANTQAIADLTEQNTQITANITQIDNLLAVISANYPTLTQLGDIAGLAITQTDSDSISIDWDDLTDAAGYIVQQASNAGFTDAVEVYNDTTSATTIDGLEANVTYFFRVKGYADGFTESDWATDNITIKNQLDPPANLLLTPGATGVIGADWDSVLGAESYDVYRHTSNVFGSASLIVTVTAPTYSDTGLTPGQIYYYWVIAKGTMYLDSAAATDNETAPA